MLLHDVLADPDRVHPLHVGDAVQKEDALDEFIGVFHLLHRVSAFRGGDLLVAPVLAHLVVDVVLVDRREFGGQDIVQSGDDFRIALHASSFGLDSHGTRRPRAHEGGQGKRGWGAQGAELVGFAARARGSVWRACWPQPARSSARRGRHPPQPAPAEQREAISSQVRAPRRASSRTSRSVNPVQWQTIMGGLGGQLRHRNLLHPELRINLIQTLLGSRL